MTRRCDAARDERLRSWGPSGGEAYPSGEGWFKKVSGDPSAEPTTTAGFFAYAWFTPAQPAGSEHEIVRVRNSGVLTNFSFNLGMMV